MRFHQLTVYHPSDSSRPFVTMGWTGFVGAITVRSSASPACCVPSVVS